MSLINDAIKRASQSDKNRPGQGASPRPMEPAAAPRASKSSWVLPFVAAVALVLAGWFFWKWWQASHAVVASRPSPPPAAQTVAAPAPPPATVAVAPAAPAPIAAPSALPPAKPAAPAPAPIVQPTWPTPLTLQGIFYSKSNPLALINGKTVGPGEVVGGAVVSKIERERVIVERNGHRKELLLEGR